VPQLIGSSFMEQYTISHEFIENIPVIHIEGDMTSESEEAIFSAYESIKKNVIPQRLLFDFQKTNYINSAGIGTLITIIESMGKDGGKASFIGLSNHFLKVMDIVGISDFVDIFETINEAVPGKK
jgi:anti-sigma B factor antagonist